VLAERSPLRDDRPSHQLLLLALSDTEAMPSLATRVAQSTSQPPALASVCAARLLVEYLCNYAAQQAREQHTRPDLIGLCLVADALGVGGAAERECVWTEPLAAAVALCARERETLGEQWRWLCRLGRRTFLRHRSQFLLDLASAAGSIDVLLAATRDLFGLSFCDCWFISLC
jgi:hypothetical protein